MPAWTRMVGSSGIDVAVALCRVCEREEWSEGTEVVGHEEPGESHVHPCQAVSADAGGQRKIHASDQLEVQLAISSFVVLGSLNASSLVRRYLQPHLQYCRRVIIAVREQTRPFRCKRGLQTGVWLIPRERR